VPAGSYPSGEHDTISFAHDVRPILNEHCTLCFLPEGLQRGIAPDPYQKQMSARSLSRPAPAVISQGNIESRPFLVIYSTDPIIPIPGLEGHRSSG